MAINNVLTKLIFRAAKLPLLSLVAGTLLIVFSFLDDAFDFFYFVEWKNIFDLTDKIGNFFISFSVVLFIYNFFVQICKHYEHHLEANHQVATLILAILRKSSWIIFILVTLNIVVAASAPNEFYLSVVKTIINAIIIGSIGWIALQILYALEAVMYQQMMSVADQEHGRAKALYTKIRILRNIASVLIVILTIAAILMTFSAVRNVGISILASAGFITAIIGLSAQKTLGSMFSGLQLAMSQTIKIGDMVFVNNESGVIEEITFTYVTLKLPDHRRSIVPISTFIEKPFENWSRDTAGLRSSLHIHVDYLMPIEPLREELKKILSTTKLWDGKASKLEVGNISERAVEIRIQVSGRNADDLSDLRAEVREKLLDFMREHYPNFFPKACHTT